MARNLAAAGYTVFSYDRLGWGRSPYDLSGRLVAENLADITRVGPGLPVLLVFADHDAIFPPDHPVAEFGYWKAHCGCDVEAWTGSDAGHALVVHTAMPAFTAKVLGWLAAKGLTP